MQVDHAQVRITARGVYLANDPFKATANRIANGSRILADSILTRRVGWHRIRTHVYAVP